jgi:2-phosphosulfolactate phosphatase
MKIFTSPFPDYYKKDFYKDKIVVSVDIFRATTTILHLFSLGIKQIILLKNEAELKKIAYDNLLRVGERFGEKLNMFDFNNSPTLLIKGRDRVGKYEKALMLTTNGTKAALKSSKAKINFIGAFNNIGSIINKLLKYKNEPELIINLAGDKGEISLEDTIFGGNLIYEFIQKGLTVELSDFSLISLKTYENYSEDNNLIKLSRHYNRLIELGFEDDIEISLKKDIIDLIPIIKNNKISL